MVPDLRTGVKQRSLVLASLSPRAILGCTSWPEPLFFPQPGVKGTFVLHCRSAREQVACRFYPGTVYVARTSREATLAQLLAAVAQRQPSLLSYAGGVQLPPSLTKCAGKRTCSHRPWKAQR